MFFLNFILKCKIVLIRIYFSRLKRFKAGFYFQKGKKIKYVDAASFAFIYEELFYKQIYKFECSTSTPYIIDAGANIGLSIIYFKTLYPNAEIVAFEPDDKVFETLEYNIKGFDFSNVTLVKKALWNKETFLEFMSEGADGGRIAVDGDDKKIIKVPAQSLRSYLNKKVDFLKIDIEGAECIVLEDCADLLHHVDKIFVEFHSFINNPQNLQKILSILHSAGFRYNIQHIGVFSPNPFINIYNYSGMDNQLNIFAFKEN